MSVLQKRRIPDARTANNAHPSKKRSTRCCCCCLLSTRSFSLLRFLRTRSAVAGELLPVCEHIYEKTVTSSAGERERAREGVRKSCAYDEKRERRRREGEKPQGRRRRRVPALRGRERMAPGPSTLCNSRRASETTSAT